MNYLTYEEYKQMPFESIEENSFNKLLTVASTLLDTVTRHYYVHNKLEDDIDFKRKQFKLSVGCQIGYMAESESTTSLGMEKPRSITMGKTSISYSTGNNSEKYAPSLICPDVLIYLSGTGLLERGI